MGHIKAMSLLDVNQYLLETYGPAGLEAIKAELDPSDRAQLYEVKLHPEDWLDLGLVVRDAQAKVKVLGKGDPRFLNQLLGEIAARQFRGVYKVLIALASPESILRRADQLWRQYYDCGRLVADRIEPGRAVLRLVDFPDVPLDHEIILQPYIQRVLELTGAVNVRGEHLACIARGAVECQTLVTWE
jgi:hypothetical protein